MTVTPYYDDGQCVIYHGDCRAILPTLPAGVGLVLTDPPYGVGYSTGYRQAVVRSSTRLQGDVLTSPLLNDTAAAIGPLLNDTAALYWFSAPERLDTVLPILRAHWDVANVLAWDKGNCSAGDLEARYGEQWEAIVYARVGRVPLLGGRDRDVLRYSRGDTGAYLHPTQKPVPLLRYLIGRHTADLILDPFMGAGSTLRAAMDCGRRAIGIELDERFCERAARRLQQQVLPFEVTA